MSRVVETVLKVTPDERGIERAIAGFTGLQRAADAAGDGLAAITPRATKAVQSLTELARAGKIDTRQLKEAAASVAELNTRLVKTKSELDEARAGLEGLDGDQAVKQRSKIAKLEKQYISLQGSILDVPAKLSKAYNQVEERARRAAAAQTAAAEKAQQAARDAATYDAQRSVSARQVGVFGDIDTALATFGSSASGIGGGAGARQLQGTITGVADIFAVTEQIGLLVPVVKSLGGVARGVSASAGPLGIVARAAMSVVPALGATAAGFLALGAVVLPLAILAGGAVAALQAFNKQQEKITKSAKQNAEIVGGVSETYADVNAAIRAGDTTGIADQYRQLLDEVDRTGDIAQRQLREVNTARAADQAEEAGNNLAEQFLDGVYTTSAEADFNELNTQYGDAVNAQIAAAASLAEAEAIAAAAGIDLAQLLRETSEEYRAVISAEEDLSARREQAIQTIESLNEQETRLLEQSAKQRAQQAEDRAVRDRRELEDYELAVADHQQRLKDIRKAGRERLAEIEQDGEDKLAEIRTDAAARGVELAAKAVQAARKITEGEQAKVADLQAKFSEASLKAEQKFAKDRLRAQEDLANRLFDAELSNDILAITRAKRAAETEQKRAQQDFDEQSDERAKESQRQIEETRATAAARLQEIEQGLADERRALQENTRQRIEEQKAATQEQLATEREAIEQRANAEIEAQARINAQRELRLSRQAEDDQRADRRRQESLREQLAEIEKKRQAEVQAVRDAAAAVRELASAADMISTVAADITAEFADDNFMRPDRGSTGGTSSAGGFFRNITQFDDGGIVPQRASGLGFFEPNRQFDEAVIPLSPRNLGMIGGGGNGGRQIVLNINAPIGGNNVTREEVRAELMTFAQVINQADAESIRGATS